MLIPFSPPPGLVSDDTTFQAQGRWADGNNVRFQNGLPEVIGEFKKWQTDALSGAVNAIFGFNRSGAYTFAFGTSTKLYVGTAGALGDETPVGFTSTAYWSLAPWGTTLLASPTGGTLYEQSGTSTATEVTQAPNAITAMLVTPSRQVMALGCNEEVSGTFNGLCIRWCDIEDYTDWTSSATNNAGEYILEGTGRIVAGRVLGDYIVIWTTSGLYLGSFHGDPNQTFVFTRIDDSSGCAGIAAHGALNGMAYWLTPGLNIAAWAPGQLPVTLECPIGKDFRDHIVGDEASNAAQAVVMGLPRFNEVWIFYKDDREVLASVNSRYIAVNVTNGQWFRGVLDRPAAYSDGIVSASSTYGGAFLAADEDGFIFEHEVIEATSPNGPTAWHIQSADQYIDNSQRRVMIRSFIPDFEEQEQNVSLTVYVRDRPRSTAVTKGPFTISTSATKKDFRASGKLTAVKYSGAVTGRWRGGKSLFDAVPLGER